MFEISSQKNPSKFSIVSFLNINGELLNLWFISRPHLKSNVTFKFSHPPPPPSTKRKCLRKLNFGPSWIRNWIYGPKSEPNWKTNTILGISRSTPILIIFSNFHTNLIWLILGSKFGCVGQNQGGMKNLMLYSKKSETQNTPILMICWNFEVNLMSPILGLTCWFLNLNLGSIKNLMR